MNRNITRSFSANEKEIDNLLRENNSWKETLSYISEELHFLHLLINSDVFQKNVLELYQRLEQFYGELQNLRTENRDLTKEVHNHRYDIEGILECEDISCEVFYHEEHIKLGRQVAEFSENFRKFKLDLFSFTGKYLRKASTEN